MPVLKQTNIFSRVFLFGVMVENVYTTAIIYQECRITTSLNDNDEKNSTIIIA